jgi:FkbM family methyltransferase
LRRLFQPVLAALRRGGVVVLSARHPALRYLDHTPASAFESALLRQFPDLRGLDFLQVGANDGHRADPLRRFIDAYHWKGLLYEPLPRNFADLQRHRGGNPRLRLRQAAIDVSTGRRPLYDLAPAVTAALPDWTRGLASFSRDRVATAARELNLPEAAIVAEDVDTITWSRAWEEFGPQRCDLLVLDTEGHDFVLLHAADLARRRPRMILFEHACNTLDERLACYRELLELGYELATSGGDTIACLPRSAPDW